MKDKSKGMKSATMPKAHFERNEKEMGRESNLKYATEMGNPKDLDRASEGLAAYVKKNKTKY